MRLLRIDSTGVMLFLALFFVESFFAQNRVVIDTANHDFRKSTTELYLKKAAATDRYIKTIEDRKVRNKVEDICKENRKDFLEEIKSGYFINSESYSGLINSIYLKIKQSNPEIGDLSFLVKLGNEPNAYNFGEEIVVVYLKYLEKINNEYQLAFTISHEIAHQILDHSKKGIVKRVQLNNSKELKTETKEISKQKYNKGQRAGELYKRIVYDTREEKRKKEIEADSLGFLFFRKAYPQQSQQALSTLELLDVIDKDNDSLSQADYKVLFDSPKQPFNPKWIQNDEISAYSYDKTPKFWQIDSLKTHPDSKDRVAFIKRKYDVQDSKESIDLSAFSTIKKSAQYDGVIGLHFIKDYGNSLYQTLLLLKADPRDPFLRKMVYENLIKIQEAQKNYTLNKYLRIISPHYSNSYNTFLYFIRRLRKSELETITELYKL